MEDAFFEPPGQTVDPAELTVERAQNLAGTIIAGRLDFVRFIAARRSEDVDGKKGDEVIIVDVDVERPQVIENDIRRVERLAIILSPADSTYPEVIALRRDFPVVPHLNLQLDEDSPRNLCLYDQSWDDVKAKWTAPGFIERIRRWLADTAIGSLHREDQPLEQVLGGSGYRLIIPWSTVASGGDAAERLDVVLYPSAEHRGTFVAYPMDANQRPKKLEFVASFFMANARQHGVIRHAPQTLEQLCDFLGKDGYDLLQELRTRVRKWKDDGCVNASLILVVAFPLQRESGSSIEVTDTWAFITMETVCEVGKRIGVWDTFDGKIGCLVTVDETRRGSDVTLDIVRPHFTLSRESAARASGGAAVKAKTVAVGAGAIGSQVILNLVRGGFGRWTIIDEDELLPHNVARHALTPPCVGWPKAAAMAAMVNSYFADEEPTIAIDANVLRPGEANEQIDTALADAELILDASASVPVARYLARDIQSNARRMSLFLNPRGSDLVLLSEDASRTLPLDALEAQYYRAVLRDPELRGHLAANEARTRYARSCRDVSFSIPTHIVSLHSGIGAQAIRSAYSSVDAMIRIWRADPGTCGVMIVDVPLARTHRAAFGDWTVVMDEWLLAHLQELRRQRLPNETGGVLVGAYDLTRKIIYVVDTIGSPADSEEKPSLYIRGCEGLAERVTAISEESAGEVEYIGEWHSHPNGCSCAPSIDDLNLFANVTDRMTAAGYPALMAIVCERNQSAWFLGTMTDESGWYPPKPTT